MLHNGCCDINCTISVTVMFIMLCNTVQATFNVTPSIVVHTNNALHGVDIIMWLLHVLSVSKFKY